MPRGVKLGTRRGKYAIEPNKRQKTAVQAFLDGHKWAEALRLAGYSHKTALHLTKKDFIKSRGAQAYFKQLGDKAMKRFGISLPDKIMQGYFDGIEAMKVVATGGIAREYPDLVTRKTYLDRFAEFFGWTKHKLSRVDQYNAYNFFSGVGEQERNNFNEKFKAFLKSDGL